MVSKGRINRRELLKKTGAIGTVSLMSMGASATPSNNNHTVDVQNVLKSPKVKMIRRELSHLKLNFSRATEEVLESNENTVTSTHIPSPTGRLQFVETTNGTTEATFFFNDAAEYPDEEHDAPSGVESSLTGTKDGTIFVRGTTEREHNVIISVLGVPEGRISTYKRDDQEGYGAKIVDETSNEVHRYVVDVETQSAELVETQGRAVQAADVDPCDAQAIYCTLCIQSAPICGACLSLCASGVGAVGCIICAVHTCGFTAADCYTCLDCF